MPMKSDELRLLARLQAGFGVDDSAADAGISAARAASIARSLERHRLYRDGKVTARGMSIDCEEPAVIASVVAHYAGTQAVADEVIEEVEEAVDIEDDPTDTITDDEIDNIGSDHADIQRPGGSVMEDRPNIR